MCASQMVRNVFCVVLSWLLAVCTVPASAIADEAEPLTAVVSESGIELQVGVTLSSDQGYSSIAEGTFAFEAKLTDAPEVYSVSAAQMTQGSTYRIADASGGMLAETPLYTLDDQGNITSTKPSDPRLYNNMVVLEHGQSLMRVEQAQTMKMVDTHLGTPMYETPGNTSSFFIFENGAVFWPTAEADMLSYLRSCEEYSSSDDVYCEADQLWKQLKETGCFTPYDGSLYIYEKFNLRRDDLNGWLGYPNKNFYRNTGEVLTPQVRQDMAVYFSEAGSGNFSCTASNAGITVSPSADVGVATASAVFPALHLMSADDGRFLAGTYVFELSQTGEAPAGVTLDGRVLTATVQVDAEGSVSAIEYASAQRPDLPATFANVLAGGSFMLATDATLDGAASAVPAFAYRATLALFDGSSDFGSIGDYLAGATDNSFEAWGDGGGAVVFAGLRACKAGTYRFDVEQLTDQPLHTYYLPDTGVVSLSVTVEESGGALKVTSMSVVSEKTGFENYSYALFSPSSKVYLDGALSGEEFEFTNGLKSVQGEAYDPSRDYSDVLTMEGGAACVQTATSDNEGAITFLQTVLRQEGTYTFELAQNNTRGYLCDDAVVPMSVNVTRDARGAFIADVTYGKPAGRSEVEFYNASPASVQMEASVCLDYGYVKDGMFTVSAIQTGGAVLGGDGSTPLELKQVNAGSQVKFDAIPVDRVGSYSFDVAETAGSDTTIVYSKAVYSIDIQVAWKPTSLSSKPQVTYAYAVKQAGDREAAPTQSSAAVLPFVNAYDLAGDVFPGIDLSITLKLVGNIGVADYETNVYEFESEFVSPPTFNVVTSADIAAKNAAGTYCIMKGDGTFSGGESLYTLDASGAIVSSKSNDGRLFNGMIKLEEGEKLVRIEQATSKAMGDSGFLEYEITDLATRWYAVKDGAIVHPSASDGIASVFATNTISFSTLRSHLIWNYEYSPLQQSEYWNDLLANGFFRSRDQGYSYQGDDENHKQHDSGSLAGCLAPASVAFYRATDDVISPNSYTDRTFFISEYQTNPNYVAKATRDALPVGSTEANAAVIGFPRFHLQKTEEGSYVAGWYTFKIRQTSDDFSDMTLDRHETSVRVQVAADGSIGAVEYSSQGIEGARDYVNNFDPDIFTLKATVHADELPNNEGAVHVSYALRNVDGVQGEYDMASFFDGFSTSAVVPVTTSGAVSQSLRAKRAGTFVIEQKLVCGSQFESYYGVDPKTVEIAVEVTDDAEGNHVVRSVGYSPANYVFESQPKVFELSFDANGGTPVETTQELKYGEQASAPVDPTRRGYTFAGWYEDAACTLPWDFATRVMPDSDLKLHAKWVEKPDVAISYEAGPNGSVTITSESIAPVTGEPVGSTAVPDVGYHFVGWEKASDSAWSGANAELMPERIDGLNAAEIYVARFAPNENTAYRVEHFLQNVDGTYPGTPGSIDFRTGTTGTEASVVAHEEAGFAAVAFPQVSIAGDGSTVVTVRYARNTHDVMFDAGGHGDDPATIEDILFGAGIPEPEAPVVSGWAFVGWYEDAACTLPWDFATQTMPDSDVKLYARWVEEPVTDTSPEAPLPDSEGSSTDPTTSDDLVVSAVDSTEPVGADTTLARTGDPLVPATEVLLVLVGLSVLTVIRFVRRRS